ncbi:MAG: type II CAAX endopeptidase family protein [Bacteroidota bacterium]
MNPFYNDKERRIRALFRVVSFFIISILFLALPSLIPIEPIEYLVRGVLIVGTAVLFAVGLDKRRISELGLNLNRTWWTHLLIGCLLGAVAMLFIFVVEWMFGWVTVTGFGWERSLSSTWWVLFVYFFAKMLMVGLYEEVHARGYLMLNMIEGATLSKKYSMAGIVAGVIGSSLIFGLMHAANPNASLIAIINITLAGVMLAVPYLLTGSLAMSVGIHFTWNFFQAGVFGFPVSGIMVRESVIQITQEGTSWITGGSFGPEAGVIGLFGMVIVLIGVWLVVRVGPGGIQLHPTFSLLFEEKMKQNGVEK